MGRGTGDWDGLLPITVGMSYLARDLVVISELSSL